MFSSSAKQVLVQIAGLLMAVTLLAGCLATAPAAPVVVDPSAVEPAVTGPAVVEIIAKDHSFVSPATIEGGWVTIHLKNEGQEPHHVQLLRLNDGVSMEAFNAALQQGPLAALQLVTHEGGAAPVDPAGEQGVTMELKPGMYMLVCFVPSADGVPHLAKGMIAPLEVVASATNTAQAPAANHEVKLVNFSFVLPQEIKTGAQVWKITNEGTQPHEFNVIKLAEGVAVTDVLHWMHEPAGAPPFSNAGGLQGINPGASGYLHLDLAPGTYVAICHIPDADSGQEHAALGMIMPFTVK